MFVTFAIMLCSYLVRPFWFIIFAKVIKVNFTTNEYIMSNIEINIMSIHIQYKSIMFVYRKDTKYFL